MSVNQPSPFVSTSATYTQDFTFKNPLIKGFFEGTSKYVPVGELLYVHTHLISDNFLSEIEVKVHCANEALAIYPEKKRLAQKLVDITQQLMEHIPTMSEQTAPKILSLLKEVYQYSTRITDEN